MLISEDSKLYKFVKEVLSIPDDKDGTFPLVHKWSRDKWGNLFWENENVKVVISKTCASIHNKDKHPYELEIRGKKGHPQDRKTFYYSSNEWPDGTSEMIKDLLDAYDIARDEYYDFLEEETQRKKMEYIEALL